MVVCHKCQLKNTVGTKHINARAWHDQPSDRDCLTARQAKQGPKWCVASCLTTRLSGQVLLKHQDLVLKHHRSPTCSLVGWGETYTFAEVQSTYSPAPADRMVISNLSSNNIEKSNVTLFQETRWSKRSFILKQQINSLSIIYRLQSNLYKSSRSYYQINYYVVIDDYPIISVLNTHTHTHTHTHIYILKDKNQWHTNI